MLDFSWLNDIYTWATQWMQTDTEQLLRSYGYYAIIFLTFLEGETIVIIAGMLAARGLLDPYLIALCAFCGSCTSDQLMFSLGKYKGASILKRFPRLERNLDKATRLFTKYDTILILGFRFVYGVRNVTPIMLGISGVAHKKFLALNLIGALVWAASFTAGGLFFGALFEHIMAELGLVILAAIVVLGCVASLWFWRQKKRNSSAP